MLKSAISTLCLGWLVIAAAMAHQPDAIVLREGATKQLSPHVWAIFGNPNIERTHDLGDVTTRLVSADLEKRYPGWGRMNFIPRTVTQAYDEAK